MNAPQNDRQFETMRITNAAFQLENEGCCLLPRLVAASTIDRISADLSADFDATPTCSGPFYGERTKRFGRLLARSPSVASLVLNPIVLALADRILGPYCDTFQLNVAQAIEVLPDALPQYPHRDQDMWWGDKGRIEYLVNIMWPLTPFTAENGATRLWPDSHGAKALDPTLSTCPIAAECEPGGAIAILGSTLHAAGANTTLTGRRAIVIGYSLGWLKPYENPWLAYPPDVARSFSPELAALVGYRQHRPNLGNFEGQCPSVLLDDRVQAPLRAPLQAIDALHPDQAALLSDYVAGQEFERGADQAGAR